MNDIVTHGTACDDDCLVSVVIVSYNRCIELGRCLTSVLESSYRKLELIVVDNDSSDGTAEMLTKSFSDRIRVIRSPSNLGAGGGRNLGATYARGKYILFIDSDNVIEKEMIKHLVSAAKDLLRAGIVGPKMKYLCQPNMIWWAGADISLWTSSTKYVGHGQQDHGQYDQVCEVGHVPNVFMISRDDWIAVDGIDPIYVMHYEESDLAEKLRRIGKRHYLVPAAVTYHDTPLVKGVSRYLRQSVDLTQRNYFIARNRIIFMRKNAAAYQYRAFLFLFLPAFTLFYLAILVITGRANLISGYLKGLNDGLAIAEQLT